MSNKLTYTVQQNPPAVVVSGPTFHHREKLKALGARWEPSTKVWILNTQETPDRIREQLEPSPSREQREALLLQQRKQRDEAKAKKLWENSPEGKKARVLEALKDRSNYHWVCCEQCEVIDWKEQFSYCKAHAVGDNAFRVRGHIFTGD